MLLSHLRPFSRRITGANIRIFSISMPKKIRFAVKIQKINHMQVYFTCGIVWYTSLATSFFAQFRHRDTLVYVAK